MGEVKWISITTDIFNDEKMCAIESLPDGLNIELVWFKLLCLAGTCNENGFLMISRDIPYTDEMMAKNFRMELGIIQRALETFQKMNMIEVVDNIYMVSNWLKYQNGNELEKIKELNRNRQRRFKERQKLSIENKGNVTNNVKSNEFCSICNMYYVDIYRHIINYLNNKTSKNYRYNTGKYKSLIHARCEEGYKIEDFEKVIDVKCEQWLNDKEMNRYLNPETLFRPSNFDRYLNEYVEKPKSRYADALERMNKHMEEKREEYKDTDIGDFY